MNEHLEPCGYCGDRSGRWDCGTGKPCISVERYDQIAKTHPFYERNKKAYEEWAAVTNGDDR